MASPHLAEKAKNMFQHAFNGYMENAYPKDDMDPLKCEGLGPDHTLRLKSRLNKALLPTVPWHDIRGGFCMTLIDSLDTLAIMDDVEKFHAAVAKVIEAVPSFEVDLELSVFELNIRVLGGLLSAHQFCAGSFGPRFKKPGYADELLGLATDLGERLLPAFDTTTGIPVARVNLKTRMKTSSTQNCPAGAGTFILEFGVLSQLTQNPKYMEAAEKAMMEVWIARSDLNLLGTEIDVVSGMQSTLFLIIIF